MEENRIPKRVLSMNLEARRPRGRPRDRWQNKVREDGSIVGREEWQGKVYDRNGKEALHSAHANGMEPISLHLLCKPHWIPHGSSQ
jgi:hypothetical protein